MCFLDHHRASYIEGQVFDASGNHFSDVNIQFLATNHSDRSNAEGFIKRVCRGGYA